MSHTYFLSFLLYNYTCLLSEYIWLLGSKTIKTGVLILIILMLNNERKSISGQSIHHHSIRTFWCCLFWITQNNNHDKIDFNKSFITIFLCAFKKIIYSEWTLNLLFDSCVSNNRRYFDFHKCIRLFISKDLFEK